MLRAAADGVLPEPASALLLIGPEGGWTQDEVAEAPAAGCIPATLGPRTPRADAAPLTALGALQYASGDIPSLVLVGQ